MSRFSMFFARVRMLENCFFFSEQKGRDVMARGSKSKYTSKQKRKAEHIEEGYEKRGTSKKEAERRAWATVNKESGGGKKSGSGRGKKSNKSSSRKGGRKGGRASRGRSRSRSKS
jgi:plasmid stabilization system protein ParE